MGGKVTDTEVLQRISGLVIPPAWADVWICPWPHGHIQAVGTDAAGRRQYRYHDDWRLQRDKEKFDRLLHFGRALPDLRKVVSRDLAGRTLDQRRVAALGVRLLDIGCFRVGNVEYAHDHETFGSATLRVEHVTVRGREVMFEYSAKGSIDRSLSVRDPEVLRAVRALRRRRSPGEELLAWSHGDAWTCVGASGSNNYIKAEAGEQFSAKDFRTWCATVYAAVDLAGHVEATSSQRARTGAVTASVKEVAQFLGNTPAVCRSSYIDPRIIDRFEAGESIRDAVMRLRSTSDPYDVQCAVEAAVLDLLSGAAVVAAA